MAEEGLDITKMIPSREIVDLKRLEFPLSTKEGFISAVMALDCGTLPKFFPNVPGIGNKNNDNIPPFYDDPPHRNRNLF